MRRSAGPSHKVRGCAGPQWVGIHGACVVSSMCWKQGCERCDLLVRHAYAAHLSLVAHKHWSVWRKDCSLYPLHFLPHEHHSSRTNLGFPSLRTVVCWCRDSGSYLPAEVAIGIACDVTAAVKHMHGCGIVPRDMGAANVLVAIGGRPDGGLQLLAKLSDLGCAKPG